MQGAGPPRVRNMSADSGTPRGDPRVPPVGTGRVRDYPFPEAIIEHSAEGLCVCHEIPEHPLVRFTVWNRRMTEITGYTMEEINRLGWYQTVYPDEEESLRAADRMAAMREGRDLRQEEWRILRKDGRKRDLVISTSIVGEHDGATHVMALMGDVSERKRAERITMRRAAILDAVAFSATTFLSSLPGRRNVQQMLERLGGVTSASRAYIFENSIGPGGEVLSSQRFEWCRLGIVPQIDNPDLQDLPLAAAGYERWIQQLGRRGLIAGKVREFPEPERALLESQDIRSLAVAPIFVNDTWWGLMGFDDCRGGRRWSGAELLALQTAADILGAALLRQRIEAELQDAHAMLESLDGDSLIDS